MSKLSHDLRERYRKTHDFFAREIWERRLDELSARRALGYRSARIAQRTFQGLFIGDTLSTRAAALTYFTVLSLVPLLALAFALLKGVGAYQMLVEETLRPYALNLVAGNQALRQAFEKILSLVEQTGVASLGLIGLLTLLYATTRLLRNIELALNEIWEVQTGRGLLQQLRDYLVIIVVTPICLTAAAALTAAGQSLPLLAALGRIFHLGGFTEALLSVLGPLGALFVGFSFLYKVMPFAPVRLVSAAIGAAISAAVWYAVLVIHVRFQVGVASYNALYSSFAAIPVFLAWLQISWLVVLGGALIAATHQNIRGLAERMRVAAASPALRETLGLAAALRVADGFSNGRAPSTLLELASELDVHEPLLAEVLERLVGAQILLRVEQQIEAPGYVLARPAAQIMVKDIADAYRRASGAHEELVARSPLGEQALLLWRELDEALRSSSANRSLEEVLRTIPA